MALPSELKTLKRIAPQGDFSEAEMQSLIDAKGINGAAVDLWAANVSATATLVDISESGSSRKNSQAHDKAKEMLELYTNLAALDSPGSSGPTATTRVMRR